MATHIGMATYIKIEACLLPLASCLLPLASCRLFAYLITFVMAYEIEYYHPKILAAIEAWPVDVLAD